MDNKKKNIIIVAVAVAIVIIAILVKMPGKKPDVYEKSETETSMITTEATTKTSETITEEVYETTEPSTVTTVANQSTSAANVEDEELSKKIMEFISPLYYNIIFGSSSYDNGFTEKDMKLFAVSYVYQHEYSELKFDTEKFILYVPKQRVEELVKEYFDKDVKEHGSYEEDGIIYEKGFYLMPAADNVWSEEMIIENIEKTGDFTYEVKVMFDSPTGALPKRMFTIEERDGRFILIGYKEIL